MPAFTMAATHGEAAAPFAPLPRAVVRPGSLYGTWASQSSVFIQSSLPAPVLSGSPPGHTHQDTDRQHAKHIEDEHAPERSPHGLGDVAARVRRLACGDADDL